MSTHLFRCPIRWGDLDAQGHVNNALYVEYLQEARVDFFLAGPNAHLLEEGVVVVGHQIEFLRPILYSAEPLEVELAVAKVGGARIDVAYEMRHEGLEVARARTVLCPFDFKHQRPRKLTHKERHFFTDRRTPMDGLRELPGGAVGGAADVQEFFVRWSDLDVYGHVNNVRFFDYVQEARIAMTTHANPEMARLAGGPEGRYLWMVARQDVDYLSQLAFRREPYAVRTAVAAVGTSSVTFAVEIVDPTKKGTVFARARTVLVCADEQGRPTPVPDGIRDSLQPYLIGGTEHKP